MKKKVNLKQERERLEAQKKAKAYVEEELLEAV